MLVYAMCAISCCIAYFVCGIPSAYIVARLFGDIDIRTIGSGNVGSTNVARSLGAKAGAITLLCDVLKAVVSCLIGYLLIGFVGCGTGFEDVTVGARYDWCIALVFLGCILGHVFTPYLHFKGGKGIASGFGGSLMVAPLSGAMLLVPFLLFAIPTRYVSLGSIMAAFSLPFLVNLMYSPSIAFTCIICLVAGIVIWSHRSNIIKLVHGEERKFSFKKSK